MNLFLTLHILVTKHPLKMYMNNRERPCNLLIMRNSDNIKFDYTRDAHQHQENHLMESYLGIQLQSIDSTRSMNRNGNVNTDAT